MIVFHSFPTWLPLTQNWMYDQVRFLPSSIECHVICEKTENLDQFALSKIHVSSNTRDWVPSFLKKWGRQNYSSFFLKTIQKYRGDCLHSHFGNVGWQDSKILKNTSLKHIVSFYGFDVNYLPALETCWKERYHELFERADRVLCEGKHMSESLMKLGCSKEKIRIYHLGVDLDEISFKPRIWNKEEPLRVLIASSFQEKKGIPDALKALGKVQQKIVLEITLIGDANEEERSQNEKKKILKAIDDNGLSEKVRLLSYQPRHRLFEEAYRHHIFLAPSVTASDQDTEGGLPVVLLQMMASGMPVVSTRHCDIPEAIEHGQTGLLSNEHDVEGIASNLVWWEEHLDEWPKILNAARRHIEEEYNARKQGERLAEIYQELINS